jgi:anti-sigma B factor antagonist
VTETPALRISGDADGPKAVLRLAGELDLATADVLRERVREVVSGDGELRQLVFDIAGLEFMDVTGLGALLEARRKVAAVGGSVAIRRPRPMVVRMLTLLDLEDALQIDG